MTRLAVVGDCLLDLDLLGRVERVSPDAPVPVVDQVAELARPGGAGLAATLAARDGCEVTLVTPLGSDEPARRLRALLRDVTLIPIDYHGETPTKRRVRAAGQSLLRVDTGGEPGRVGALPLEAQRALRAADAVLVSDYGRGMTGHAELRQSLARLRAPVVWDPHPRGAAPVPGTRLATPNQAEAAGFAGSVVDTGLKAVTACAHQLVAAWRVGAVAVTLGERGALLSYGRGAPVMVPAPRVVARDACGAGDRFAVTAALQLAAGAVTEEAVEAAVKSAARFVANGGASSLWGADAERGGVAGERAEAGHADSDSAPPPDRSKVDELVSRVRARGGTVVATGGCFDLLHAGHVASLRAARQLGDCLVVCLNSDASVRRLKGPGRPLVRAADRARILEALECVDAVVVFDEDTPAEVLRRIRPDIFAKGGDYAGSELPEAKVLAEWGGQAVVLPYVPGRSTTGLVRRMANQGGVEQ